MSKKHTHKNNEHVDCSADDYQLQADVLSIYLDDLRYDVDSEATGYEDTIARAYSNATLDSPIRAVRIA